MLIVVHSSHCIMSPRVCQWVCAIMMASLARTVLGGATLVRHPLQLAVKHASSTVYSLAKTDLDYLEVALQ